MKRFVLILAAVAMIAGASAQEKSRDWAQFGRYEKANEEVKASGVQPDAVFMGNSITDGWAAKDPQFFVRNNFVGRGISGQTTSEMLVRFRRDVLDLHPKLVLIMAGTNDIAQNNGWISLENALGNIESMCELARANGVVPILCSLPPAYTFGWRPGSEPAQTIVEMNGMIRAYAESNGIAYVDYWSALADERGGIPAKWSNDEVHPNPRCYIEVFEPMALEAVNKALNTDKNYVSPLPQQ